MLDADDVWGRPIHTIDSGPAAAPIARRHYAKHDCNSDLSIVTDAGGTTFGVGLVQNGQIPWYWKYEDMACARSRTGPSKKNRHP